MTEMDLSTAADVLGRAADRLEKLAGAADGGAGAGWAADGEGSVIRESPDDDVVLRYCADPDAEFIATVDPHAVAALVPPLRTAAEAARRGRTLSWDAYFIEYLTVFARRVLRGEADGD